MIARCGCESICAGDRCPYLDDAPPPVERGIAFSAPMVRALLAGRKTQTRRLATSPMACRRPGDRLWVREAWRTLQKWDQLKPSLLMDDIGNVTYEADPENRNPLWAFGRLRPAMFMPRWASRLTLVVTGVRVEPLQAITAADVEAEGCVYETADPPFWYVPDIMPHSLTGVGIEQPGGRHAARCYEKLWSLLHTAEGQRWQDNPAVVVLSFSIEHTR